jgi:hypothetical protein
MGDWSSTSSSTAAAAAWRPSAAGATVDLGRLNELAGGGGPHQGSTQGARPRPNDQTNANWPKHGATMAGAVAGPARGGVARPHAQPPPAPAAQARGPVFIPLPESPILYIGPISYMEGCIMVA